MECRKLILPGWAIPPEKYSVYSSEQSRIYDYGFFNNGCNVNFENLHNEIGLRALTPTVLIGHSMGSAIAIKTAAELSNVVALVLISPFARFVSDDNDSSYLGQEQVNIDAMTRMITKRTNTVLKGFYRDTFYPCKSDINIPEELNDSMLLAGLSFLSSVDYRDLLSKLTIPVLILHGECDRVVNSQLAQYLNENIKKSDYISIPSTGHALPLTDSHKCNELICCFLEKHSITLPESG